MNLVEKIETWKKHLNSLAAEKAKAEGRHEQSMEVLKGLGYDSIEAAVEALSELQQEQLELEGQAEELLSSLEEKYADFIKV